MGRVFKRDGRWAIDYIDHRSRRVRRVVSSDKSVAQRVLAAEMQNVEKRKAGVLLADPAEAAKPLQAHIDDHLAELERLKRAPMYIYNVRKHLENAAFAQDWETAKDCTVKSVGEYLRDLAAEGKHAKTVNQHRADLSGFFEWCVKAGAMPLNPCDQVQKSAVTKDKKRRALSVEECRKFLAAAPTDRRAVYTVLIFTGLRRSEAAALRWVDVRLDVANPYVELPASLTKGRRVDRIPLAPEAAEALRAIRGRAKAAEPVFDEIPSMDEFRADLAAAGIEEKDGRGRVVVLHSLRHSLATMLARSQVPPAIAMKLMRHSDIRLTLELYADAELLPAAAAVAALPSLAI